MRAFFNRLRIALLFARHFSPRITEADWTDQDSLAAARFFDHGTGLKLLLRLETGVVNLALEASQKGSIHACGVANGAAIQLQAIRAHSQFPLGLANQADSEESDAQAALEAFASQHA